MSKQKVFQALCNVPPLSIITGFIKKRGCFKTASLYHPLIFINFIISQLLANHVMLCQLILWDNHNLLTVLIKTYHMMLNQNGHDHLD